MLKVNTKDIPEISWSSPKGKFGGAGKEISEAGSKEDLVLYVVADNPMGESCYYPDSHKWLVRSPARTLLRAPDSGTAPDYYGGEE